MAIVHTIPGQEEHNARALLRAGCAIRCDTPAAIVVGLERLLRQADERERMSARARAGALPEAADTIAKLVAEGNRQRTLPGVLTSP